jgi:uncharacterized protein
MAGRHIPERTCVACRTLRPKRDMTRVVRAPDGAVAVDETGKQSGRGAYLCRRAECWTLGLKRRALDKALKTELSAADRETLTAFGATLPAGEPVAAREERGTA